MSFCGFFSCSFKEYLMKMPKFNKHRTCARTNPTKKGNSPLQSATCTVKRPAASTRTQYRRKGTHATENEVLVARAFKELRVLHPHKVTIGRGLVGQHLAGALSAGVLERLLRNRTFSGQHRQLSPGVLFHYKCVAAEKKGKTTEEWNDLSQNSNSRLSRKQSYF